MNGAVQEGERREKADRELAGKGEPCEGGGLQRGECIADQENANPVIAIGDHAAERHQHDVRCRVHQRDDGEPARRMGQIPCGPGHGHGLNEEAEPGHDGTD